MRYVGLLLGIIAILAFIGCGDNVPVSSVPEEGIAAPAGKITMSDITVVGTNNPAVDLAAVQMAVDAVPKDGTVLLKGTFDFGGPGDGLIIDKGLTLTGEVDMQGGKVTNHKTRIHNGGVQLGDGAVTIECGVDNLDDQVIIKNLEIEGNGSGILHWTPTYAGTPPNPTNGGNLEVVDCKVTGSVSAQDFGIFSGQLAAGSLRVENCEITSGTDSQSGAIGIIAVASAL